MNFTEADRTVIELAVYAEKYIYNLYLNAKKDPNEDWIFPSMVVAKATQLLKTASNETSFHKLALNTKLVLHDLEDLINLWKGLPILEWDKKHGRTKLGFGWKRKKVAEIKERERYLERQIYILKNNIIYNIQIMMAIKTGCVGEEFEPDRSLL